MNNISGGFAGLEYIGIDDDFRADRIRNNYGATGSHPFRAVRRAINRVHHRKASE
ncbi:MAG: hypothetical protein ABI586_04470 [Candidatus Nanopelagicales bacterium]